MSHRAPNPNINVMLFNKALRHALLLSNIWLVASLPHPSSYFNNIPESTHICMIYSSVLFFCVGNWCILGIKRDPHSAAEQRAATVRGSVASVSYVLVFPSK